MLVIILNKQGEITWSSCRAARELQLSVSRDVKHAESVDDSQIATEDDLPCMCASKMA